MMSFFAFSRGKFNVSDVSLCTEVQYTAYYNLSVVISVAWCTATIIPHMYMQVATGIWQINLVA